MTEVNNMGGVPMVKIDGSRIRSLREEKGLTQLYLATSVEVTTDTISRWENRRYPTIKKENALKLAEALEVELDEILDIEEEIESQPEKDEVKEADVESAPKANSKLLRVGIGLVILCLIVFGAWWFDFIGHNDVYATRILPQHTAPGQPFPVVVKVESEAAGPLSVILREVVPAQAEVVFGSSAKSMAVDPKTGEMKWIHKIKEHELTVGYLLQSKGIASGGSLALQGTVNLRSLRGRAQEVAGGDSIAIAPYHWADINRDNQIDDQEILIVYEDFSEVQGVELNLDLIEEIWFGSGYQWDVVNHKFIIEH